MKKLSNENVVQELLSKNVILYGGGITGKRVLQLIQQFQIKIEYIVDDDENKWGNRLDKIKIISFTEFMKLSKQINNISVILTSIYGKTVLKKLEKIEGIQIYEMYGWVENVYRTEHWSKCTNKEDIANLESNLNLIKDGLEDEESIKVVDGICNYLQSKELRYIYDICTEHEQYFIPEVLRAIAKPLNIVDAGAYEGEIYQIIRNYNIDLNCWYCFEPDHDNYEKLLQRIQESDMINVQIETNRGGYGVKMGFFILKMEIIRNQK